MKKLVGKINKFMTDDPAFFLIVCVPMISLITLVATVAIILAFS